MQDADRLDPPGRAAPGVAARLPRRLLGAVGRRPASIKSCYRVGIRGRGRARAVIHCRKPFHVRARPSLSGRPHPQPERGFPERSPCRQGQPDHRHLFRRSRPHPRHGRRPRGRGRAAGRHRAAPLPADGRPAGLSRPGAGTGVRRRQRRAPRRPHRHRADAGRVGRAESGRRFPQALFSQVGSLGQRPELGKPSHHFRGRRLRGAHISLLRRRQRRPAL
ncbi:Uncharacterised protein [Bordetella pertussis]|nr:Uncharacterised protein [Bordetella pertussis]